MIALGALLALAGLCAAETSESDETVFDGGPDTSVLQETPAGNPAPDSGFITAPAGYHCPAVTDVLPRLKVAQVKAKIASRLLNRNWELRQNRNDSLDFMHDGDSVLVAGLFRRTVPPRTRVVLRFGLRRQKDGTAIQLSSFLLVPDSLGRLRRVTAPADPDALTQNLRIIELQEFGAGALIPKTTDKPQKRR